MRIGSLVILAGILIGSNVYASGGASTGGGELIRDGHNPWFLGNVKEVSYCLDIDEGNFGQTRALSAMIVRKALENWKSEFKNAVGPGAFDFGIATQTFTETACGPNTDLRFQLGTLNAEQRAKIDEPSNFIGIAVRTDYDRSKMRGKGFIYVSPPRGPLKYSGPDLATDPWALKNGALLYFVVVHELGHVFGLTHSTDSYDLMNERRIELGLNKDFAPFEAERWKNFPQYRLFRHPDDGLVGLVGCATASSPSVPSTPGKTSLQANPLANREIKSLYDEFFGIPADVCPSESLRHGHFAIRAKRNQSGQHIVIGRAELERFDNPNEQAPAVLIWLPREQTVFHAESNRLVSGPMRQLITLFKGIYKSTDGKIKRQLVLEIRPGYLMRRSGSFRGEMIMDISSGF